MKKLKKPQRTSRVYSDEEDLFIRHQFDKWKKTGAELDAFVAAELKRRFGRLVNARGVRQRRANLGLVLEHATGEGNRYRWGPSDKVRKQTNKKRAA